MKIEDLAYTAGDAAEPRLIVDDGPLLGWAGQEGVTPQEAQLAALSEGIVPARYLRNFQALTLEEQIRLCRSTVFVCGCGGLGGVLIDLLARAGVGALVLADGDSFVPSNLNRQWLSEVNTLSRSKAIVGRERVEAINPFVRADVYTDILEDSNAEQMLRGADLALDALDNLPARFLLAEAARKLRIPFIHAAVAGWWGQITTFSPDSPVDLSSIYSGRRSRDSVEESMGVLGPTAAIIGSLEAMEAIRVLTGRGPAYANQLLYFDGESGRMESLPLG